jgi:hypothetical protein
MRFEPRLFRDDDQSKALPADQPTTFGDAERETSADQVNRTCQFELELPTGLAALGEQLADDADHLARCYPAGKTAVTGDAPPLHDRRLLRWGGAAAAIVISIATWQLVAGRIADEERPENRAATVGALPFAAVTPNISLPKPSLGESGLPSSIFRRLTGAEQEAVLDLMQDDPQGKAQLSI